MYVGTVSFKTISFSFIEHIVCLFAFLMVPTFKIEAAAALNNYIILDGIEGCMRIYCTRHDDIHRAGTAR